MHEKSGENFWKKTGRQFTKKGLLLFACVFVLLGVTGCKRKAQPQGNPGQGLGEATQTPSVAGKGEKPVSQDYPKGGCDYMMTERGQYYVGDDGVLRYYDFASKRSLPLCNKPECRHDGNMFCVASSKKYTYTSFCLYSGKIYITGIEETDTQYLFKLLAVALDGSALDEIVTYLTLEKTEGLQVTYHPEEKNLFIHRNKAFLPVAAQGQDGLEDVNYYGTAVYDLGTKELHYLDEEPLSKENLTIQGLQGAGNAVFYYTKERKKITMYRYDVTNDVVEPCKLQAGFRYLYAALDEDTVAYRGTYSSKIYLYHHSTGSNEVMLNKYETYGSQFASREKVEELGFAWPEGQEDEEHIYLSVEEAKEAGLEVPDGYKKKNVFLNREEVAAAGIEWREDRAFLPYISIPDYEKLIERGVNVLQTDGEYFYILDFGGNSRVIVGDSTEIGYAKWYKPVQWLCIYDRTGSRIAMVDIWEAYERFKGKHPELPLELPPSLIDGYTELVGLQRCMCVRGDGIYFKIPLAEDGGYCYCKINRDGLLAGKPEFELVFVQRN